MPSPLSAPQVLDRVFLEVRARLLEIAAQLDRIDRAGGSVADDPRLARIRRGLELLREDRPDRAEQVQLLFSLPYEAEWRETFALSNGRAAPRTPK
jgi:hypothetical protein